jgi:hypothetical protein
MVKFLAPQIFGYISGKIKEWERDVASARRGTMQFNQGISNRLFKVGMKYFGSGTSNQSSNQHSSFIDPVTQLIMFPYNSAEMIMRRLADFAFMIQDYKYALSIYENVKKDFATVKFSKFFAGIQVNGKYSYYRK